MKNRLLFFLSAWMITALAACNAPIIKEHSDKDTLSPKNLLNVEKIIPRFPYRDLTCFRITDTLKLSAEIDTALFARIYQFLAKEPYGLHGSQQPAWQQILKGKDHLISYQGVRSQQGIPFHLFTTYAEYNGAKYIYLLTFPARQPNHKELEDFGASAIQQMGRLSRPYAWKLAYQASDDSLDIDQFSYMYGDSTVMVRLTHYKNRNQVDSLVTYFGQCYYDLSVHLGEKLYTNGKLVYDDSVPDDSE